MTGAGGVTVLALFIATTAFADAPLDRLKPLAFHATRIETYREHGKDDLGTLVLRR